MLQNYAWVKHPMKVQDRPMDLTITCTKISLIWFQIPYCNKPVTDYHFLGLSVVSKKNIQKCQKKAIKIFFPFQTI